MDDFILSIIVPIYNTEIYLRKCIDSLINQTLSNIEIILINDGSTDGSEAICNEYAKLYKNIIVINKENKGLSDSRNIGLKNARGKYIGFVDSDDWVSNKMFETLYKLCIKNDADIAQCDFYREYKNNEKLKLDNISQNNITIYSGNESLQLLDTQYGENMVVLWNKIYKREIFEEIEFPIGKINEDEYVTYKLLHKSKKIIDINVPMYHYRQRDNSIMNKEFNMNRLDIINALEERREYYKKHDLHQLAEKTDAVICSYLKSFSSIVYNENITDKENILKVIKEYMLKYYVKFLLNKQITFRGKISLTLCLLNGKIFAKLY